MEDRQIEVLLSDYDGTLCPTISVRGDGNNRSGMIPNELEQVLVRISERIPVCIISSKGFAFLHERVRFANILSCALGIETIIHNPHYNDKEIVNFDCIRYQHLTASSHSLMDNSKLLHNVMKILQNHKDIMIEETSDELMKLLTNLAVAHKKELKEMAEALKPCPYCNTQHFVEFLLLDILRKATVVIIKKKDFSDLIKEICVR